MGISTIALTSSLVAGSLVFGAAGLTAAPIERAAQPSAAAGVNVQTVHYQSGAASIEGYLARPQGGGRHPAVVVVHDDLGLNEPMQGVARLFAAAGFVALAPNLLSRSAGVAGTPQPASGGGGRGTPVARLPTLQTQDDVKAGYAFLQQDMGVDAAKISAVGFGWGGYRVWKMAQQIPTLFRAVVFYGVTPTDDQLAVMNTSVLAHYAQFDFLNTATALKTQKQLGKRFSYYIYPTDRGFFGGSSGGFVDITALTGEGDIAVRDATPAAGSRAGSKSATSATDAAKLAWTRTLAFLRG
jgi:dienelactone hydrolase